MSDQPPMQPTARGSRFTLAAALLAMAAPLVWVGIVALEITQAQLSHSLVSRPERLFGAGLGAAFGAGLGKGLGAGLVVLPVCVWLALLIVPLRAFAAHQEHRRIAWAALLAAVVALLGRAIVAGAPTDSDLYQVSELRGLGADAFLVCLPLAVVLFAVAGGTRATTVRWLSAATAIAMVWVALWATQWSVQSGALQPQLWAVEPVEGLGAFWVAAVGIWLLGWPAAVRSRVRPFLRLPAMPSPGRKAAVAFALVGVLGVVAVSADYVTAVGPTIAAQLTGRTRVETIRVGDYDRAYRVYRPAEVAADLGLVIVLHGVFGSGFQAESSTGFDAQADRLGWVVAYPDGVLDGWDALGDTPYWGRHPGVDDVAFIGSLIDRLSASDRLDSDRVYVTGFSRGAMMTYRLGCELSGRVAAIAPVSGNMATADGAAAGVPCQLNAPVSVLAIHGTADGSIPIAGGHVDIAYSPMTDVIARWRELDSCTAAATIAADGSSTTTSWACGGGATVAARVVSGGVHAWPGAVAPPYWTSVEADSFDAARLIADFFAAHPRARA